MKPTMLLMVLAALLAAATPVLSHSENHSHASVNAAGTPAAVDESPFLKQGQSWETAFPVEARIRYHCHPHENMTGVVRVSATDPAAKDRVEVDIQNYAYAPADIVVKPGGVVNWTNLDPVEHNVMFVGFEGGDPYKAAQKGVPGPGLVLLLGGLLLVAVALRARRGAP